MVKKKNNKKDKKPKTKSKTRIETKPKTKLRAKPKAKKSTKIRKALRIPTRTKKILEVRKKLICQKEALLAGAEEALNELPEQTTFPDLGDQATAETDRSLMLRLRGRERKLLKKIEEAIERIDQGIFGICDKCGEDIDIRRLEARPVTTMCIECKTLQEEEEKLTEK